MKFEKRVPKAREVNRATSYCGVKQLVAGLAHNQEVAGSSPASATKLLLLQLNMKGVTLMDWLVSLLVALPGIAFIIIVIVYGIKATNNDLGEIPHHVDNMISTSNNKTNRRLRDQQDATQINTNNTINM